MSAAASEQLSPDAEYTEHLGAQLARAAPNAERPLIVYLCGDLGAGKTTLVRGFLRGLGYQGIVRSPTYPLVELYEVGALVLVHLDLYRLREPSELTPLGLQDFAVAGHTWLIEWPERAAGRLPPPDLTVELEVRPTAHRVRCTASSALGQEWLRAVS